ncbi:DMSO reductase anchor subunit [Dongia mobilis]|uniref:DMSO reductase anchor subunit n=1 Tax=Dongia mobilis TaxID=578943 RepID=A0A4R6WQC1_9PROT|nr:DmsC/YnfH family molybdoenzyme membrane anchor subunit [Dongia mobilis]TDQ81450.1 DMSO reductase anchor subunit [Dongia mobilis]
MHPAYSVIFFTTASGAGYALLALMSLMGALGMLPAERWFGLAGFLVGLIAVTAGLLSSTYHLGRPERAWRAFSQWRSSWLSREGVLALFTYVPAGITALGWVIFQEIWLVPALVLAAACMATTVTTSMIYASLKTVRRWSNCWTTPAYLAMGLASGAAWLFLLAGIFALNDTMARPIAMVALLAAGIVKYGYWRFIDTETGVATSGSATGLDRFGKVRLLTAPHTEENYLLKEMGYRIARRHAVRLRAIAFGLAILLPLVILPLVPAPGSVLGVMLAILAVMANAAGTLAERWLFFAEARHTVTLYYGAERA